MIHKGLNAIRALATGEVVSLSKLERVGIQFPALFKVFLQHFEWGENSLIIDYVNDTERGIKVPLNGYFFRKDKGFYGVDSFLGFDQIIETMENDDSAIFHSDGTPHLIRIAETTDSGGGGFYLGLGGDKVDKIYKINWDDDIEEDSNTPLADDIFEFVSGFFSETNTFNQIDFDKLYKNWGEDFWRIQQ